MQKLKVVRPHHRLLRRLLEMLTEDGWLQADADGWVVARAGEPDLAARHGALVERFGAFKGELDLIDRCGAQLAGILRGQVDPLQVLFPGGSAAQMEGIYRDSPMARTFNELVAQAVQEAVALTPDGRVLRVLEVGAGSGATTDSVLRVLAGREVDYLFTDISAAFTSKARERFRGQPSVRFGTLDASRDPVDAGLRSGLLRPGRRGQRDPRHTRPPHHPGEPAGPAGARRPARDAGGHHARALRRPHRRVHVRLVGVRGPRSAPGLRAAQPGAVARPAGGDRVRRRPPSVRPTEPARPCAARPSSWPRLRAMDVPRRRRPGRPQHWLVVGCGPLSEAVASELVAAGHTAARVLDGARDADAGRTRLPATGRGGRGRRRRRAGGYRRRSPSRTTSTASPCCSRRSKASWTGRRRHRCGS